MAVTLTQAEGRKVKLNPSFFQKRAKNVLKIAVKELDKTKLSPKET
jgi:hypothetical protein